MKRLFLSLFLFLNVIWIFATEPIIDGYKPGAWTMDLVAAEAAAAKTGLPILMKLTNSDGCGHSVDMDNDIFSRSEWQQWAASNVIMVLIDFSPTRRLVPEKYRARNDSLGKKYEVTGYPTFVMLENDGHTVLGRAPTAFSETKQFISTLLSYLETSNRTVQRVAAGLPATQAKKINDLAAGLRINRQELIDWQDQEPVDKTKTYIKNIDSFLRMYLESRLSGQAKSRYDAAMERLFVEKAALRKWLQTANPIDEELHSQKDAQLRAYEDAMEAELDTVRQELHLPLSR